VFLNSTFFIDEFKQYFRYIKSLKFMDLPDYDYLKRLFRDLYLRQPPTTHTFDWEAFSGVSAPTALTASIEQPGSSARADETAFGDSLTLEKGLHTGAEIHRASDDNNSSQAPIEDSSVKRSI
jgi:hypothetical protein